MRNENNEKDYKKCVHYREGFCIVSIDRIYPCNFNPEKCNGFKDFDKIKKYDIK